jgi:hypothetical protein
VRVPPAVIVSRDVLPIAFYVRYATPVRVTPAVDVVAQQSPDRSLAAPATQFFRVREVTVEGNSNGACACPAGQVVREGAYQRQSCQSVTTPAGTAPLGCPTPEQQKRIQARLIRAAPFSIRDTLQPISSDGEMLDLATDTLFVALVTIPANLPVGELALRVTVSAAASRAIFLVPLRTTGLRLEGFPALDLSYWLSEDPRDLVSRPAGTALGDPWGGDWWSEFHWKNLERAAKLQGSLGVTNVLVPLFVRNPFGIAATPLVSVRCITGTRDTPGSEQGGARFNTGLSDWRYEFDFTRWRRFVGLFDAAGFRQFEWAHLFGANEQLPNFIECDLYARVDDTVPYRRNFRFLPRAVASAEDETDRQERVVLYRDRFLPAFLDALRHELERTGISDRWWQHIIDENPSSEQALASYADGAELVRRHLPAARITDAINQYVAPRYAGLIDRPVLHLALLFDDQMPRKNIRTAVEKSFSGPRLFYNTALREGGPNRFLDGYSTEERAQGWLALELGYQGLLYWAANQYRNPAGANPERLGRDKDWTPYRASLGPRPGGKVAPGYGPGANWNLYPTPDGLVPSMRALRLRDGLLDHWLYLKAEESCVRRQSSPCHKRLEAIRNAITGDTLIIADFATDPANYDAARHAIVDILEGR